MVKNISVKAVCLFYSSDVTVYLTNIKSKIETWCVCEILCFTPLARSQGQGHNIVNIDVIKEYAYQVYTLCLVRIKASLEFQIDKQIDRWTDLK